MKKYYLVIGVCTFLLCTLSNVMQGAKTREASTQKVSTLDHDIKILVLIITSDDLPVYKELQKIWRSYMHYDPKHVEAYFIRGDPNLSTLYQFNGDVIWSQTTDGLVPDSAGILNKTILSLEALMPRMHEFDYILRTNLSSFYVFPRLLKFLKTLPKTRCYCGSNTGGRSVIGSGCGFLISPDVAKAIVKNKHTLLNISTANDDQVLGGFIRRLGISLIQHPRMDFFTLEDWYNNKDKIRATMFHFRIKHAPDLRLKNEVYIKSELLKTFYT